MIRYLRQQTNYTDWLLFLLVILITLFFRFYHLTDTPPGLVFDAGVNGRDAWRLLHRGGHTVFLSGNGGRESAWVYLQALSVALSGTTPLAARLPGAIVDTLTVVLGFWFAHWLFRDRSGWGSTLAALWSGLGLATAFWLLAISRLGFRAVLVPPLAILVCWSFLLGWQRNRPAWFALTGLGLGLAGYTYSAARVLPLVLLLAALPAVWSPGGEQSVRLSRSPMKSAERSRRLFGGRLAGLLLAVGVAGLVFLPMLHYTVSQPDQITNRPFSVALWAFTDTPAAFWQALGENALLTAGFFCCRGNTELILFGPPGRPGLDFVLGALLLLGLGRAAWRIREMGPRLLLLWFLLALIPGLLTIEAPHPLRLILAAPAAVLLFVYGGLDLIQDRPWPAAALTGWLVLVGVLTFRDYFIRWPALAETPGLFEATMVERAEQLTALVETGQVVYLPRDAYARPSLQFYLSGPFPPRATFPFTETAAQITIFDPSGFAGRGDGRTWVRLSAEGAQILPSLTDDSAARLGDLLAAATMDSPERPPEDPVGVAVDPTLLAWQPLTQPTERSLGPARLLGAAYPPELPAQSPLVVTLFWEALRPMNDDYPIVLHLVDDGGQVWSLNENSQAAGGAYPTSYWRPGLDRVPDTHRLVLKEDLPPGRYRLAVALFDPGRGQRFFVSPPAAAPDTVFLGPLKAPLAAPPTEPAYADGTTFGGLARLQGYDLAGQTLEQGELLQVTLFWEALAETTTDYTVFVHLLDEEGEWVAGHDAQPQEGAYPTGIWSPGEQVPDAHSLDTSQVPAGRYHLAVGLYDLTSGERLPAPNAPDNRAWLATPIEIRTE